MKRFDQVGFLCADKLNVENAVRGRYGKELSLCEQINEHAQQLQYDLKINNRDVAQIFSATYYGRVISTFQGAIILSLKGMRPQVEMMTRCLYEPVFPLVAISKNREFAKELAKSSERTRWKMMNKIIRYKDREKIDDEEVNEARKVKREIESKCNPKNLPEIGVFECAKMAGLESHYDTMYSYFSNVIHAGVASLQDDWVVDNHGKIIEMKNEPDITNNPKLYGTMIDGVFLAMEAIIDIFALDSQLLDGPNSVCQDMAAVLSDES